LDAPETASETVGAREAAMRVNEIKGMKRKRTSTWLCGVVHAAHDEMEKQYWMHQKLHLKL
jgi:hypothetical protein